MVVCRCECTVCEGVRVWWCVGVSVLCMRVSECGGVRGPAGATHSPPGLCSLAPSHSVGRSSPVSASDC